MESTGNIAAHDHDGLAISASCAANDERLWSLHGVRLISISLIVTTYNRPDALQAVLAALAFQTDRAFEVGDRGR